MTSDPTIIAIRSIHLLCLPWTWVQLCNFSLASLVLYVRGWVGLWSVGVGNGREANSLVANTHAVADASEESDVRCHSISGHNGCLEQPDC